jgi:hypothetical protein
VKEKGRIEPFECPDPNAYSGVQYTFDARHRVTAEPDRVVVKLDRDQAVAAEAPALTGNIRARIQDTIPAHERSDAPIAASAHRILGDPVARRERAHFKVGIRARLVQAENIGPGDAARAVERATIPAEKIQGWCSWSRASTIRCGRRPT